MRCTTCSTRRRSRPHIDRGVIEIAPLAFMRGRTLNDSFVILDEAQNTTPEQMKMFLTRLGFGSRMVVTGDITQVDLPREQQSGLIAVGEVLDAVEDVEFIRFGGEDVVRHKLVQRIVEAYDAHSQRADRHAPRRRRAGDPKRLRAMIDVEVFGESLAPEAPLAGAGAPALRARGREPRRRATGTWRSSTSSSARIAELNDRHRGKAEPTDVLSFPIDGVDGLGRPGHGAPAGIAGARRRDHLPRSHRRPARGDRPRHAASAGHGPRDRLGRDAGAAGRALETTRPTAP